MYSIFIRDKDGKYTIYQAEEGVNFAGTLAEAKAEYVNLMKRGTPPSMMLIEHNTVIDLSAITVTDVTE